MMLSIRLDTQLEPKRKLGEVTEFHKGVIHKKSDEDPDGEYTFVTCSITGLKKSNYCDFTRKAITLNRKNGSGKSRLYLVENYGVAADVIHFSAETDLKTEYLYHYLRGQQQIIEQGYIGAAQKGIGRKYLKQMTVKWPSTSKMKKILKRLNRLEQTLKISIEQIQWLENSIIDLLQHLLSSETDESADSPTESVDGEIGVEVEEITPKKKKKKKKAPRPIDRTAEL